MAAAAPMHDLVLAEMGGRLVAELGPQKIYLFGSRGRGEAAPDSDYDLMVVVADSLLPRWQRDQQAFMALCGVSAAKDVLVYTQQEFDSQSKVLASLPYGVLNEGQLVYVA